MVFTRHREWVLITLAGMIVCVASLYSHYIALAMGSLVVVVLLIHRVDLFFYAFLCCLMLTPKLTINGINVRVEDGITIFFAAQLTVLWMTRKEISIPEGLWKAILSYLGFSLLVTVAYMLFGDLSLMYMMYWLKELQYILYFVVAFYCANKHGKPVHNLLTGLFLVSIAWGLYQLAAHKAFGYYGIGLISEPASSQSGGAFFIITIYMFYLLQRAESKKAKLLYLGLTGLGIIVTFSTVSRTAISALLVVALLMLPLYLLQKRKAVMRLYFTGWLLIALYFSLPYITRLMGNVWTLITGRFSGAGDGANLRMEKWHFLLSFNDSFVSKMIGMGKGFPQTITGGYTLATDSQYVRLLSEVGIIGLILFLAVIVCIIRFALKNWKLAKPESMFLLMMTIGFMVMSFTHEVFTVTLQASMFWMMTGVFTAKIMTKRESQ